MLSDSAALGLTYLTSIGIVAASYAIRVNQMRKSFMREVEDRAKKSKIKSVKALPRTKTVGPPEKSMKVVNPNFPQPGTVLNCTFCTAAMALREKGYDVMASNTDHPWHSKDLFGKVFNAEEVKIKAHSREQIIEALSKEGDGAYGGLTVGWTVGGGHSVFWKNDKGKIRIFDGQSGEEYDVSDPQTSNFLWAVNVRTASYQRLDNCQPTDYCVGIVVPRK